MRMQPSPPSRQDRNLQYLLGLGQLDRQDVDTVSALQQMAQGAEQGQLKTEGMQLENELNQGQVNAAPQMTAAKLKQLQMSGIGDLAHGMSYAAPQLAPDVLEQMLTELGLYHADPQASLKKKAAKYGMTVEQLQQQIQKLNSIH